MNREGAKNVTLAPAASAGEKTLKIFMYFAPSR
jgi:hypothetical protein